VANDSRDVLARASERRGAIAVWSDFCAVAPSPELKQQMKAQLERTRSRSASARAFGLARQPRWPGFNDGVIIPPDEYPAGTSSSTIRRAALDRAPLRGAVRVIVVLVDYSDKHMTETAAHFNDLFFSTGVLPHGSVKEYFTEVTGGLVDMIGEVKGPYRLPQTLAWYANNNFGIGQPTGAPRANIMARDAAVAANADVNFGPYDNDGNGFVDAFIVVHAGGGGEQTGNPGDIWAHKWTLPSAFNADGTKIFAYLTVAEDSRIGVCAHELGHLLFGFPDLYDTDYTSEGVGNWCLMGGGSWNGGGDIPAHPSAWCKVNQGWTTVNNVSTNGTISIPDVKTSRTVHRLWTNGASGSEYFLVENRQTSGYDAELPAGGLLVWHIDENQPGNTDENRYQVGLVQADGKRDLELDRNRGDGGDPFPGSANNTALTGASTPSSNSYAGGATNVAVTNISVSGAAMTVTVAVTTKSTSKDTKDQKDATKEPTKERKDLKDSKDGQKEANKDAKESKDRKDNAKEGKERWKERKDNKDSREWFWWSNAAPGSGAPEGATFTAALDPLAALEERVRVLEEALGLGAPAEPFIDSSLRPDLTGGPSYGAGGQSLEERMAAGDRDAKLEFDNMPRS
jgi:immune inhibitor A